MTRLLAVNGATLPRRVVTAGLGAGFGDAPATPLAPTIVMPATTAVAPTAAAKVLVLSMIPLSWVARWLNPAGGPGPPFPVGTGIYQNETESMAHQKDLERSLFKRQDRPKTGHSARHGYHRGGVGDTSWHGRPQRAGRGARALRHRPAHRFLPGRVLQHRRRGPGQPHDQRGGDRGVPGPPARHR